MATTVSRLQSDTNVPTFYYLKITGIPYYFFGVVDPTDTQYATDAWTLPAGYAAAKGMMLPSDTLQQTLTDIIGGVASAERLRLTLLDFTVTDANGSHPFISRLFAPGRLALAGPLPELTQTIQPTNSAGTFTVGIAGAGTVIGATTPWIGHIGGEAIKIAAPVTADANGTATLTISQRNQFPCSAGYPTPFYHRAVVDNTNAAIIGRNPLLTVEPMMLLGRSAAFYIGHMTPSGRPCLESEAMLRLVGRITLMDMGTKGNEYTLTVESLMADVSKGQVASDLAVNEISPVSPDGSPSGGQGQLVVIGDYCYATVKIVDGDITTGSSRGSFEIAAAPGTYTINGLIGSFNGAIANYLAAHPDSLLQGLYVSLQNVDGMSKVSMSWGNINPASWTLTLAIRNGRLNTLATGGVGLHGLLDVFGWDDTGWHMMGYTQQTQNAQTGGAIFSDHPWPIVFIPLSGTTPTTPGGSRPTATTAQFNIIGSELGYFANQGDGSGKAYVRFSDGQIAELLDYGRSGDSAALIVGQAPSFRIWGVSNPPTQSGYFRADNGTHPTVEQVVLIPGGPSSPTDPAHLLGPLLASTGLQTGNLDIYPAGIGMGLNGILDSTSVLAIPDDGIERAVVIDSTTTLDTMFTPISKEYGFALVWDSEISKFAIKQIRVPSVANSHAIVLSESNRVTIQDRTAMTINQSNTRSAWVLHWGWDRIQKKYIGPPISLTDAVVRSAYGKSTKTETVEDPTLAYAGDASGMDTVFAMFSRSYLYRQQWLTCKRSMTKAGLLMCPGNVHQVIDATVINPFTGLIGISAADRIYCLITDVSMNPATGQGTVSFVINRQDPSSVFRVLSPSALVDFSASANGYNNGTGVLTLKSWYASDGVSFDGVDFLVNDTVDIVSRDSDGSPSYEHTTVISAVAGDGHTVTVASGLGAVPTDRETVMFLRDYANSTATRQAAIAFQGNAKGKIEAVVVNNRWT